MIGEIFEKAPRPEQRPAEQLIGDLLPRYYEVFGENQRYSVERSIMVDGHEVAWLKYEGVVEYDNTGEGREGQPYIGHELECACKFTEGIGWRVEDDGRALALKGGDDCIKKKTAVYLRHLELRQEYETRQMLAQMGYPDAEELEAIMLDLVEKAKASEFLEGTNGVHSAGGCYYLQTVASIADMPMDIVWETANKMAADKKIQLEDMVVQPYSEPAASPEGSDIGTVQGEHTEIEVVRGAQTNHPTFVSKMDGVSLAEAWTSKV